MIKKSASEIIELQTAGQPISYGFFPSLKVLDGKINKDTWREAVIREKLSLNTALKSIECSEITKINLVYFLIFRTYSAIELLEKCYSEGSMNPPSVIATKISYVKKVINNIQNLMVKYQSQDSCEPIIITLNNHFVTLKGIVEDIGAVLERQKQSTNSSEESLFPPAASFISLFYSLLQNSNKYLLRVEEAQAQHYFGCK